MENENQTSVNTFILLGLSDNPNLQVPLFVMFLIGYVSAVAGNTLLILAVRVDRRLHVTMYFFLSTHSFLDICYTSVSVPKMLVNIAVSSKSISFAGCFLQIYFNFLLGETQPVLLGFMAYDRFVAISYPLRYNVIMSTVNCLRIIIYCWVNGCIISSFGFYLTYQLRFCGPNTVDHFFCQTPALIKIACNDFSSNFIAMLAGATTFMVVPLCLILYSYVQIFLVILKIHSGRHKAFSTCTSHLIVVILYYGPGLLTYMQPRQRINGADKFIAVFYTIITPTINPLIYSLRNKDVHQALRQVRKSMVISLGFSK